MMFSGKPLQNRQFQLMIRVRNLDTKARTRDMNENSILIATRFEIWSDIEQVLLGTEKSIRKIFEAQFWKQIALDNLGIVDLNYRMLEMIQLRSITQIRKSSPREQSSNKVRAETTYLLHPSWSSVHNITIAICKPHSILSGLGKNNNLCLEMHT